MSTTASVRDCPGHDGGPGCRDVPTADVETLMSYAIIAYSIVCKGTAVRTVVDLRCRVDENDWAPATGNGLSNGFDSKYWRKP